MIIHAVQESRLAALPSFSPTEILLLTGYWPVMGTSLAICTREGNVCAVVPDSHALPRIHPESHDTLGIGMTFNIEPPIYVEDVAGMRRCDVVACTHDGVEVLTDF